MKVKETNVLETWANQYPEVTRWLGKLQVKAKNAFSLYRFCQWCNKEPSELLALKKDPGSKEAERLLDTFVADENTGFTNAVRYHLVTAVKSFFKHNYEDLARACGVIDQGKVKPYYKPSKKDLRKIHNWCLNPRDKALITFVNSTAIAKETLSNLKWKHIEENWQDVELPCLNIPSELLKGHGRGRYKGVQQITFLTPEAKQDLIVYKEWIEAKMGRTMTAEDNVWREVYKPYGPVKYKHFGLITWDLQQKTGIPFNWHDARRYVETALEEIRISPNWARKIRGRKVKGEEAPYSRPAIEQLRQKFREAVPLLEFTQEKVTVSDEVVREKVREMLEQEKAEEVAKELHIPVEQVYRALKRSKKIKGERADWAKVREILEKQPTETNGGFNVHNCQKIVDESKLAQYLAERWRVQAVLPSGKIVVEKNET